MKDALAEIKIASRSPAKEAIEAERRAEFDRAVAADIGAEADRRAAAGRKAAAERESEIARRAGVDRGTPDTGQAGGIGTGVVAAKTTLTGQTVPLATSKPDTEPQDGHTSTLDGRAEPLEPAAKNVEDKDQALHRARAAKRRKSALLLILVVTVAAVAAVAWWFLKPKELEAGFLSGNGRIEATEIDASAKSAGRISTILVNEGDFVKRDQVVALMDTKDLDARRAQAIADLAKAQSGIAVTQSKVAQEQSNQAAAAAVVVQRRAELNVAVKRLARSEVLSKEGAASVQDYDNDLAGQQTSAAAVNAGVAQLAAADAAIVTARAQATGALAEVDAAGAAILRIESDIDDSALKSPRDGRVQYRVAQPSEVVAAGGIVLNIVDLTDVYMTLFLPDAAVGRVALGAEVRIVLDAAPQFVIPAKISFVADVAQFTPKTVETASERQKLMFRIKAQIDPALLRRLVQQVKTGLPGVGYVRIDATKTWPNRLAIHVPD